MGRFCAFDLGVNCLLHMMKPGLSLIYFTRQMCLLNIKIFERTNCMFQSCDLVSTHSCVMSRDDLTNSQASPVSTGLSSECLTKFIEHFHNSTNHLKILNRADCMLAL